MGVNGAIAYPMLRGVETVADPSPTVTHRLADQATGITKDLVSLALAVVGALSFLFSDKVSAYWRVSSDSQRRSILLGGLLCLGSVLSGLLTSWGILSLSADENVRAGLHRLLALQAFELLELAIGLGLIAYAAVVALDR